MKRTDVAAGGADQPDRPKSTEVRESEGEGTENCIVMVEIISRDSSTYGNWEK
jgi:hypothetical protein